MDKSTLKQLCDSRARIKYLKESVEKILDKIEKINAAGGMCVADAVTCGKKGKRSLGTKVIRGFPYPENERLHNSLDNRRKQLEEEEQQLLEQVGEAEAYIAQIESVEMRNIFSLYYIEDLNWVQVAHRMNDLYGNRKKSYTESSCRQKHDRFLEK